MIYDLHSHSTASDGVLSPEKLVERAAKKNVQFLALTDHDTTDGIAAAQRQAEVEGITLVPGIEFSTLWKKQTIHVVGLNIDPTSEAIATGVGFLKQKRVERTERLAARLEKCGVENALHDAKRLAGEGNIVTRTHFARLLIERNLVKDSNAAFKKWLGHKGRAHVAGDWASLTQAVEWIVASGGQAVIAHPGRYRLTRTKLMTLLGEFKDAGGEGLEVSCSSHDRNVRQNMAVMVRRFGLKASVGSDFHVPGYPYIELGYNLAIPDDLTPIWQNWH
ncbi:MAG: PHP domain-containing protein [Gammaproteobacteria bacterium]|nr:PHP domain-containing protein [Gammaproteobacteria bacterium]MDH5729222.1 PHP domain-containing protein [Gammaproteobacteria bacterium]